ncbi:MAG: putative lipid II flippase FtsW [Solirubrobacterales bacterium]
MRLREGPPDFVLFMVTVILVCIGLIMVFSASAVTSSARYDDAYYFAKKQVIWAVISFLGLALAMRFRYEKLKDLGKPLILLAIFFLIVVRIPGIGHLVNGSYRNIALGPFNFTPSEFAKICLVLFLSANLARHYQVVRNFTTGLAPYLGLVGLLCGLIMLQPDLGSALVIAGTGYCMLLVAGARFSHMGLLALVGVLLIVLAIQLEPYRAARLMAFWDPWKYPANEGFQTIQSLYALGSGGLFGVGLGQSRQKFFYLPEQHTDFIFAILGEELGLLGVLVVLSLFFVFAWRGFRIALKAPDTFGSLLSAGITMMIIIQAVINLGVVSGALPVTGIPLPFISYGGSSLMFTLAAVGLLLNISRYANAR